MQSFRALSDLPRRVPLRHMDALHAMVGPLSTWQPCSNLLLQAGCTACKARPVLVLLRGRFRSGYASSGPKAFHGPRVQQSATLAASSFPAPLLSFSQDGSVRCLSSTIDVSQLSHSPAQGGSKRRSRGPVMAAKMKEGAGESQGGQYKDSVNLPQTGFGMRANSAVREPEIQKFWEENQIVHTIQETNPGETFTLHDGPPYANGDLHIGHALNKILKDFVNRYQLLQGRKAVYVPGWDCHGLPIELKVLQSMDAEARKALTPIKLRKKAAQFARKTVDSQRADFKRWGVWGEWENPYMTLMPEYEAAQIGVFMKMVLNGHIYRGRKPVHWSPSSGTALAEAELEYPEQHISRSIYVAFKLTELPENFPKELKAYLPQMGLAIWTTTPWTMPGNAAVAVNDKLNYAVVELAEPLETTSEVPEPKFGKGQRNVGRALSEKSIKYLVVAEDLVAPLAAKFGLNLVVNGTFLGSQLEHAKYVHPLEGRESPVVVGGDYITTDSGTGLVHTAPGHGQEDYLTGLKYGLPLLSPVDNDGNFTEEAGKFAGQNVLGEGNVSVIKALDEEAALLLEEAYAHKYPYDWRTKKPTIFRATEQWFASVEGFRKEALEAIGQVQWFPPQGEKRITAMTVGRSDWCISRQRSWGVPIPVFYHVETGEPLMNEEIMLYIQSIIKEKGSDAWFQLSEEDLLPEKYRSSAHLYRKGMDTMDVWFDSGSSWAAVVEQREGLRWPADLYLEGSDQHRGWFQSSLLTSVAAAGRAPYKQVLTHGFVLDDKGYKMSKSLGNVVDPRMIIDGGKNQKQQPAFGADVLRLWVASVDYTGDVLIGPQIISQMSDVYRKLRGTLRFILGNIHDWKPEVSVAYEELPVIDKYVLWRLASVMDEIKESYDNFQFYRFFQLIQRFVVIELSNFYFDICKDRLYVGGTDSFTRRACQTVLGAHIRCLLGAISPVLPHMAEDAWQNLPFKVQSHRGSPALSVFEALWPTVDPAWRSFPEEEVRFWATVLQVRSEANKVLEQARTGRLIGANMDAKAYIYVSDEALTARISKMSGGIGDGIDQLRSVLLTSQVEVVPSLEAAKELDLKYSGTFTLEGQGELWVGIGRADGAKCERCWNYSKAVGSFHDHPLLCERCHPVILEKAPKTPVAV